MPPGFFIPVLHCHLPYVRHPEHEHFLEENWFYEAVAETYLPLLRMLRRLRDEGVSFQLTLSLSPTLCEMMGNKLLRRRCGRYLDQHVELAEKEVIRKTGGPFGAAAELYAEHYRTVRRTYAEELDRQILPAFADLGDSGHLELIGSAATHALLPLVDTARCRAAQVEVGLCNHRKHFGSRPAGFWLPECAYRPGLEELLAARGIEYFFLDTHGLLLAEPRPPLGVFAPLKTPEGVFAFGRDVESSRQVWSADEGYPGHPDYREFYRDLGFDADWEHVAPYLPAEGERAYLGLKYHRVTGDVPLDSKEPYDPQQARRQALRHADEFVDQRVSQVLRARRATGTRPAIVAPYDAELFGHWWFEGMWFLERVLRRTADTEELACVSAGKFLAQQVEGNGPVQEGRPHLSSWGYQGYFEAWVNGSNDWMYPRLHRAETLLLRQLSRGGGRDGLLRRALDQAARQLLLAQSSDWPFLISCGTAGDYASRRFKSLLERFHRLLGYVESGEVDRGGLLDCERRDDIFPGLELDAFRGAR